MQIKKIDRQTDTLTDRQTGRQNDWKIEQTEKGQTHWQTDKQKNRILTKLYMEIIKNCKQKFKPSRNFSSQDVHLYSSRRYKGKNLVIE